MYTNNAYLNNSTVDRKDKSKPLVITMCGTYKLYTKPKLPTWRPRGRLDFQLLYIAAGKAHFHFGSDTEETIVPAGHMVLYRPKEPQKYEYYANDQTEVFWVHFTGNNVTNLLRSYGLTNDKKVFYCGFDSEYKTLFQSMIKELQMCQDGYPEMLEMYKKLIEMLPIKRRILFVADADTRLPVRRNSVDVLVACMSDTENSFYSKKPYIQVVSPYLKENAVICGSLLGYRGCSRSQRLMHEKYPEGCEFPASIDSFLQEYREAGYHIQKELLGVTKHTEKNNYSFTCHVPGECLSLYSFHADKG